MPRWDIFCRVIDNLGDIGVCWRLARQLAHEFDVEVCLWVDELAALACFCTEVSPELDEQNVHSVHVRRWAQDFPRVNVADVIIEAFACELPQIYLEAMLQRSMPTVWINLEYLTAEAWIEDCHLLPSRHSRLPLTKYFFFPGFTPETGGLIREAGLLEARNAFNSDALADFLVRIKITPRVDSELWVLLFCYDNPRLPELFRCWLESPTPIRVFATPGAATEQLAVCCGVPLSAGMNFQRNSLRIEVLPYLSQPDFDRLMWLCDVNFVRGEDSFVRAQWAQQPFVWQIYPQSDQAHLVKLDAFLGGYLKEFQGNEAVRGLWSAWNGQPGLAEAWQNFIQNRVRIQKHCQDWAFQLDRAGNLANNLSRFVREKWATSDSK